ncbi:MAG: hypothetical protein HYV45_00265 [Candidatus Moranbacteria bacterium]|nr:hypothetical protein [Candidatus Moranbacteria bacterium]
MNKEILSRFCGRIKNLFSALEFRLFIFFLALLVLSGPFMVPSAERTLHFPFVYYFSVWCVLIGIIFGINICKEESDDDDPKK